MTTFLWQSDSQLQEINTLEELEAGLCRSPKLRAFLDESREVACASRWWRVHPILPSWNQSTLMSSGEAIGFSATEVVGTEPHKFPDALLCAALLLGLGHTEGGEGVAWTADQERPREYFRLDHPHVSQESTSPTLKVWCPWTLG